jgi:adenylate cyclase
MTRFKIFRIKNGMLFANFISNLIGVSIVRFFTARTPVVPEIERISERVDLFFMPLSFLLPFGLVLLYERPIRRYAQNRFASQAVPGEHQTAKARQRLLNEPFFMISLNFGTWMVAALVYCTAFWLQGAGKQVIHQSLSLALFTGLITTTVAFFVLEFVLQKRIAPHFFPNGGLYQTPGTLRIRISTRMTAFLFACNLVPFITMLSAAYGIDMQGSNPSEALRQLQSEVVINAVLFIAVGLWVTILVSANLRRPLEEIIRVLGRVKKGDFDQRVRVTTNDEIGYTGDVINEMTEGLKERDFIKETFGRYVSEEIRDEILSGRVPLDGETREVTVLFADLRNFTPMVESTPPKEVVRIINGYFKEMEDAINRNNGLVLQYIGDEIEAVFGAPIYQDDHPESAVKAALEMQRRLRSVNLELAESGHPPLSHGIGIHTGEVVAANIGSPDRLSYALVGDTVNLASRLQGLNKEFGTDIILSATTGERLENGYPLKKLPDQKVKGIRRDVAIYTVE